MTKEDFLCQFVLATIKAQHTYYDVKIGNPLRTFEGIASARADEALAAWNAIQEKVNGKP